MENELGFIFVQQGTTKQEFYNVDTNYWSYHAESHTWYKFKVTCTLCL